MSNSIQITMICFAALKEKLNQARLEISLEADSTCADFKKQLAANYPTISQLVPQLLVARNGAYLKQTDIINDQDELACFPPVSGG